MASKKLGDLIIALVILLFLVTGFSQFIIQADSTTSVNSGISGDLSALENNLSGVTGVETGLTDQIDVEGDFVPEENREQDSRSTDAMGMMNLLSKNVLVRWIRVVGEKLNIPSSVLILAISLIAITITILFVRTLLGEYKI